MRILSCVAAAYYDFGGTRSYEYVSFVEVLRRMGHTVHHFDYWQLGQVDRAAMNDFFVSVVARGAYDVVLIVPHKDEFLPEALDEARRHAPVCAWNCDDDWRWDTYSSKWAPHYTWMVTTYRSVYEAHRRDAANLLLSQWGCTGFSDGLACEKDLAVSFVGSAYGSRKSDVLRLRRSVGMVAYGRGVPPLRTPATRARRLVARLVGARMNDESAILPDQDAVHAIWNRSKVAFTPLASSQGQTIQIKARVFEMGLNGAVMVCTRNPELHSYYEPEKEYIEFGQIDEAEDRIRFLLRHESVRRRIAEAYHARTRAEHLWPRRFAGLFGGMGLPRGKGAGDGMESGG